jgi:outer membrane protein assembly factor BamB
MRPREEVVDYHGWVMRYEAASLTPAGSFCTSVDARLADPTMYSNPAEGAGIWQAGAGLSADADGNVYFATGNSLADKVHGWYGDSVVKLHPTGTSLVFVDAFAPSDAVNMEHHDLDLGSGGTLNVPDSRFVIAGGKTGVVYLIDGTTMALLQEFQAFTNTYHPDWTHGCPDPNPHGCADWAAGPHLHGSPTYWRGPDPQYGYYYHWGEKDYLKRFRLDLRAGRFDETPLAGMVRATEDLMPGGMLSVSSRGNNAGSGVVWAILRTHDSEDHLYAFNAETLAPVWDTTFPRTLPHTGKWLTPTIAAGKVVIATDDGGFAVYGLRDERRAPHIVHNRPPPYLPHPGRDAIPLAERFESEEAIGALQQLRRQQLTPPGGTTVLFSARDTAPGAGGEERLSELGGDVPADKPALFGRRVGNTWEAADGSAIVAEETRSVESPAKGGAPWQLFRVTAHRGQGRLAQVEWIQRLAFPWLSETRYVFFASAQR